MPKQGILGIKGPLPACRVVAGQMCLLLWTDDRIRAADSACVLRANIRSDVIVQTAAFRCLASIASCWGHQSLSQYIALPL